MLPPQRLDPRTLLYDPGLSRRAFFAALATDPAMRSEVLDALAAAPFSAWFWETPPMSPALAERPSAFVLVDSPALARVSTDPDPFAREWAAVTGPVGVFPNLSGDARLVVPRPGAGWTHFAAFVRTAPPAMAHALLTRVGKEVGQRLAASKEPFWVSTSGLGVHWLHVRLDERPKYYAYEPWRSPEA